MHSPGAITAQPGRRRTRLTQRASVTIYRAASPSDSLSESSFRLQNGSRWRVLLRSSARGCDDDDAAAPVPAPAPAGTVPYEGAAPDPEPVTMRVCAPGCEETSSGARTVAPRGAGTFLSEAVAEAPGPDLLLALCRRRASTRMQLRVLGLIMAVRMSPTMGMSLIAKSIRAQRSIAARVGAGRPPWTFLAARMSVRALISETMSEGSYVSEVLLVSYGLKTFSAGSS